MSKTVLALDPAMAYCGWQVLEVQVDGFHADKETHNFDTFRKVVGGTLRQTDTSHHIVQRMAENAWNVRGLINQHKPWLLALEGPLTVGQNKSPTGVAQFALIVQNLIPNAGFQRRPEFHYPEYVAVVRPERLNSLAYQKRKTTGTETVQKYVEATQRERGHEKRVTQHEADAFFIGYYATRFIKTSVLHEWPSECLFPREARIYQTATKDVMEIVREGGKMVKGPKGKAKRRKTGEIQDISWLSREYEDWWRVPE